MGNVLVGILDWRRYVRHRYDANYDAFMYIITTAAFGLFADIPEMLKTMPWGLLLAIGWIGFGGAMGIVEVLAHRK